MALGVVYMAMASAPMRYLGINVGALTIGLTLLVLLGRTGWADRWTDAVSVAIALTLLGTALAGVEVEGAARWVILGGVAMQPSLVLLPLMVVAFSRTRSQLSTAAVVVAAAAMALQPDRAMAGMLALCTVVIAAQHADRFTFTALAAGVLSLAATLARPDVLPAAAYVDQILFSSFAVHVGLGFAVLGGAALLMVPSILGWLGDTENRATYAVFGTAWFVAIIAAAIATIPRRSSVTAEAPSLATR